MVGTRGGKWRAAKGVKRNSHPRRFPGFLDQRAHLTVDIFRCLIFSQIERCLPEILALNADCKMYVLVPSLFIRYSVWRDKDKVWYVYA